MRRWRAAGTRWSLVQIADPKAGVIKPSDPMAYIMELQGGRRLAMQLDCNRASGHWEARSTGPAGGTISMAAPALTRALCPPGSLDTRIAGEIELARSYALEGETLTLTLEGNRGVYTWRRLAATP
jgi:heat shock protein HslJ